MTDCKNCKYTDEYCASGECTSQSPRNGSQKGDLTSQWKKGELQEGDYFISNEDEIYPDYYDSAEGFLKTYDYGVRRVIAEVPSYEAWMEKTKSLKVLAEAYCKEKQHNAKLKELLKEIRGKINTIYDIDLNEFITSAAFSDDFVKKIDEVLK